jgi:hypothetical protein
MLRGPLLALLMLAAPGLARAQEPQPPFDREDPWAPEEVGVHTHDGFMFRLTLGAGLASFAESSSFEMVNAGGNSGMRVEQELEVDGAGLMLALDVGFAMNDSASLHLRLSEMSLPDPAVRAAGETVQERGDTTRAPTLLGPAITYYVMPWNLHATAMAAVAVVRQPGYDGDSSLGDLGWGVNLDVGGELWVHSQWGVGGVLRLLWLSSSGEDAARNPRSTEGWAIGLLASATYQ